MQSCIEKKEGRIESFQVDIPVSSQTSVSVHFISDPSSYFHKKKPQVLTPNS